MVFFKNKNLLCLLRRLGLLNDVLVPLALSSHLNEGQRNSGSILKNNQSGFHYVALDLNSMDEEHAPWMRVFVKSISRGF